MSLLMLLPPVFRPIEMGRSFRHCEEQSDEAIQSFLSETAPDCFATLAMISNTVRYFTPTFEWKPNHQTSAACDLPARGRRSARRPANLPAKARSVWRVAAGPGRVRCPGPPT